jgi:hypothetical protein
MAIILRYSKSLWAPIMTHSLKDRPSNVIFHSASCSFRMSHSASR